MPDMELSDSELATLAGRGDTDAYRPGRKEIQNFSAYLYRIARNLACDEMRRRARFADVDEEILVPEDPNIYADPQRALLLGEQLEAVRRAAGRLNENQRAALILRELEELDYDQMSAVLESNRNAVGALVSRARLKFREEPGWLKSRQNSIRSSARRSSPCCHLKSMVSWGMMGKEGWKATWRIAPSVLPRLGRCATPHALSGCLYRLFRRRVYSPGCNRPAGRTGFWWRGGCR